MRHFLLVSTSMLVGFPASAQLAASGQPKTSAQEPSAAAGGIEDIVVTARRRAENLQSVPIAVTAITAEALRTKSISTPYDLVNSTPGLNAQAGSATRNDVNYFIRGQGTTNRSQPSVVTYFADVPQQSNESAGGSNITFYDLESIQVLKGPQGTLFGRSTTGGAVLLTPKKPTGELDGFFEASLGNYSSRDLTGALNIPIIDDNLALRVAGNYSYHSGYARSLTTGQDLDDRNRSSFRISLLIRPADWLSNTIIFTDVDANENGTAAVLYRYKPQGSLLDTTPGSGLGYFSVVGLCSAIQGGPTCVSSRLARIDRVKAGLDAEYARLQDGGSVRRLPTSQENSLHSHVQTFINTTELDLGKIGILGDTSFKNVFSSTRNLRSEVVREIQGSGDNTGVVYNDLDFVDGRPVDIGKGKNKWGDVYTEEAQISGRVNDRHDWLVGYFRESSKFNTFLNWASVFNTLDGAFTIPEGLPAISGNINKGYKLTQTGYFGQTTIDFADFGLDGLKFTAGYRRSIVKNKLVDVPTIITPNGVSIDPNGTPIAAQTTQKASSYTFALDYTIAPRVLIYATTRKGFKQGGINIQSISSAQAGNPSAIPYFGPETVTDYEIGAKTDWRAGGISARTNVALFTATFSDLQRSSSFFNGQTTSAQIGNIGKSRAQGVEIDNQFRFSPAFTVGVSYAYLDHKYKVFPGTITRPEDGTVLARINTPVTGAPKHQANINASYLIDGGSDVGRFVLTGDASYKSRTNLSDDALFDSASEAQAGFATFNARLDWNEVMGNAVDLSIFVRNITDKTYKLTMGNLISSLLGTTTAIYGDPRIIGVQARVRFGVSGSR